MKIPKAYFSAINFNTIKYMCLGIFAARSLFVASLLFGVILFIEKVYSHCMQKAELRKFPFIANIIGAAVTAAVIYLITYFVLLLIKTWFA